MPKKSYKKILKAIIKPKTKVAVTENDKSTVKSNVGGGTFKKVDKI